MRDIHICFATDDGYAPYCAVAIKSIIVNAASNDKLFFYILHAGLSEDKVEILKKTGNLEQSSIRIVELDKIDFEDMPLVVGGHFSRVEAYFRFAIPRMFQNIEKMLYLDCDILVRNSLWELYNTKLDGKMVGMVENPNDEALENKYFNSGVLLIDCKKWRDENAERKLLHYAIENKNINRCLDQDVINGTLQNDIFELEDKYNKQIYLYNLSQESIDQIMLNQDIVVLHYLADRKPWHGIYQNKLVDEYFLYMEQTLPDYSDIRGSNRTFDPEKYYRCLACLRGALDTRMINRDMELLLIFEEKIKHEFELAANELGFLHIESALLADIREKSAGHTFMLIDSNDYGRILKELRPLGYIYRKDYGMMGLMEDFRIEKELMACLEGLAKRVIVYGTGDWADRCTAVSEKIGAEILFYIDSDKTKDGSKCNGKDVIHPGRLSLDIDYDKIVIASSAFVEIKENLLERGIDEAKIHAFDFMKPLCKITVGNDNIAR